MQTDKNTENHIKHIFESMQTSLAEIACEDDVRDSTLGHLLVSSEIFNTFDFLFACSESKKALEFFYTLLDAEYRTVLDDIMEGVNSLKRSHLFNEKNLDIILEHEDYDTAASALACLQAVDLMSEKNIRAVLNHENAQNLVGILTTLVRSRVLTQKYLDSLVDPIHRRLSCDDFMARLWAPAPAIFFTGENVERFIRASEKPNPIRAIDGVISRLVEESPKSYRK